MADYSSGESAAYRATLERRMEANDTLKANAAFFSVLKRMVANDVISVDSNGYVHIRDWKFEEMQAKLLEAANEELPEW